MYTFVLDFGISSSDLDLKKNILLLDTTGLNGEMNKDQLERLSRIRLLPQSFQLADSNCVSLYDKLEVDDEKEDTVFSTRNFFQWVLKELLCEEDALNIKLASLFRKTKYYNKKRDDITEAFKKLADLFNDTINEVKHKQNKIKEEQSREEPMRDDEDDKDYYD